MKVKLIDIQYNPEEVEFGTCELCFSDGEVDNPTVVFEVQEAEHFKKGEELSIDLYYWDYGDYEEFYLPNTFDFADWVSKQDFDEQLLLDDEWDWITSMFDKYEHSAIQRFVPKVDFYDIDDSDLFRTLIYGSYFRNLLTDYEAGIIPLLNKLDVDKTYNLLVFDYMQNDVVQQYINIWQECTRMFYANREWEDEVYDQYVKARQKVNALLVDKFNTIKLKNAEWDNECVINGFVEENKNA